MNFIIKKSPCAEKHHEIAGRYFCGESQRFLGSDYGVSKSAIYHHVQRFKDNPEMKAQALEAASLFYSSNPGKRPKAARSSTHPAAASHGGGGPAAVRAITLPPQVPAGDCTPLSAQSGNLPLIPTAEPIFPGEDHTTVAQLPRHLPALSHGRAGPCLNVIPQKMQQKLPDGCIPVGQAFVNGPARWAFPGFQGMSLSVVQAPPACTGQQASGMNLPTAQQPTTCGPPGSQRAQHHSFNQTPEQLISSTPPCIVRPPPPSDIDQELRNRVYQRAPTQDIAGDILDRLSRSGMYSLGLCQFSLEGSASEEPAFNAKETDLLLMSDEQWNSKSEWLDEFIQSIPQVLRDDRITNCLKMAVHKTTSINSLDDLKQKYAELVELPYTMKKFFKKSFAESSYFGDNDHPGEGNADDFERVCMDQGGDSEDLDHVLVGQGQGQGSTGQNGSSVEDHLDRSPEAVAAATLIDLVGNNSQFNRVVKLQRIVHGLIGKDFSNPEGHSGTIQPKAVVQLLFEGFEALVSEHGRSDVELVDLGFGFCHVLWGASLSGLFKGITGVELPSNKEVIENFIQQFHSNAKAKSPDIAEYSSQFNEVQLKWINCRESNGELEAILARSTTTMIYWFLNGWAAEDVLAAAKAISQSPFVRCVVCIPRDWGRDAWDLLKCLNSTPGQKMFYLQNKKPSIPLSGSGECNTAYTFVRSSVCEFEKETAQPIYKEQRVDVIFEGPQWHHGFVVEAFKGYTQGSVRCSDGQKIVFDIGDPEVFLHPMDHNQWQKTSENAQSLTCCAQCSYCTLCSEAIASRESRCCARCRQTAYHLECLRSGYSAVPPDFVCPYCRAELAEIGRSQKAQFHYIPSLDSSKPVCSGCGVFIEVENGKLRIDSCVDCGQPFGHCCSSRTSHMTVKFRCPSCVGIIIHDSALAESLSPVAESVESITQIQAHRGKRKSSKARADDDSLMDEFVSAVVSLQDKCQWQLGEKYMDLFNAVTRYQVENMLDPSAGPYHLLNFLGLKDGPDIDLVHKAIELNATHCKQRALQSRRMQDNDKNAPQPDVRTGAIFKAGASDMELAFLTADMRPTPFWQLTKCMLLEFSTVFSLFIVSRPPANGLCGDPHWNALLQRCTLINFEEGTSDSTIANYISKLGLRAVTDAGGPTLGSLSGVMFLLPKKVLRVAFLGFPWTHPGGHIDITVVDEIVLPLGSRHAMLTTERLMYTGCYQPNDSFRSSVPIEPVRQAPETRRSDWNLPENEFVFAFFCRSGRISEPVSYALVEIAKGAPNAFFWCRRDSLHANARLKALFSKNKVDIGRIIFSCDVPGPEHRERIRHADMGLDSFPYGAHTTCSDFLLACVPFLAWEGEYFPSRVSSSLVRNMLGTTEFVCTDMKGFVEKAIYFATDGRERVEAVRAQLKSNVNSASGICDGRRWIRGFERGLRKAVELFSAGGLQDIFLVEPSNVTQTSREFVVLLEEGEGGEMEIDESRCFDPAGSLAVTCTAEDPPLCLKIQRDPSLWLSHIKDLVKEGNEDQARAESLRFIQVDLPEGREIHHVRTADGGTIPAIQLPLQVDKISSETRNKTGCVQLHLLYVAKGPHGLHLYSGEEFSEDKFLTGYDGRFVADSSKITDFSRVVSLSYSQGWAVDGGGVDEVVLVLKGSLGCMSNHAVDVPSNAKFVYKTWISPISECVESCWLKSRIKGGKHTEVTTHYTPGSADRHGIPPRGCVPGVNRIAEKDLGKVKAVVRECMDKTRISCGFDMVKIHGSGAFGTAVQVRSGEKVFTIKYGLERYDKDSRGSALIEAAMMGKAQRSKEGIFALQPHTTSGWSSGAALVTVLGQRIAAVSMESADMDAHSIFANLGERFRVEAGDKDLLPDTKVILKAVLKTVKWMHNENMAHCDITPHNIFLKKLSCRPDDERVAYFDYQSQVWQVVLGDWGHSRWDGENGGNRAVHRYSSDGKVHGHIPNLDGICISTKFSEGVVPVGKQQLQVLYGLRTAKPSHFIFPGNGTILIRPPNQEDAMKFCSGEEQRRFDKASDVWAVGVLGARICAAPLVLSASHLCKEPAFRDQEYEKWPENLRCFSRIGSSASVCKLAGSSRAGRAVDRLKKSDCCDLWLAEMAFKRYSDDAWPHLRRHMHGDDADEWREFLLLLQGLLAYPISDRLSAAEALGHQCFLNLGHVYLAESDD